MSAAEVAQITENPAEQSTLGRSTIRFPYLDQDDAVDIARKIFEVSGNSCEKFALAAKLDVSADGGGFNLRIGTAKMYGFVTGGEKGALQLTPLGLRVINPQQEKAARAESFILVPLYKAVYEDYKGQMLPANPALEAHMEKLGVAPKQKDKARQVFQRSATQAGYFAFGNNRLVAPQVKQSDIPEDAKPPQEQQENDGNAGGNGGGKRPPPPPPPGLDPVIAGLMAKLPAPDTDWSKDSRRKWLQALMNVLDLTYKTDPSDTGELKISLEKSGASA